MLNLIPGLLTCNLNSYNLKVYHNFHDEVDSYRQHWWRCDGACRSKKPFFGYVKRSMNRAPSKNDTWWAEHQRTCGGTYTKIKEPENYGKKKGKEKKEDKDSKENQKGNTVVLYPWVEVFRNISEFRILRLTFHRKSASKC